MKIVDHLELDKIKKGTIEKCLLNMTENALGSHWQIPVITVKGKGDGPVLGLTAALHGNELNGIGVIHSSLKKINPLQFNGTLIAIPVLNIPGFLNGQREYSDGKDLNRTMPGKKNGTSSEVYSYKIINKVGRKLDYLIDLHTASFGRINSLYVRANLDNAEVAHMAHLQEPQIIVNSHGEDKTFRKAVADFGVKAITVEVGDPHVFQKKHIRPSSFGINNVLIDLGMINEQKVEIHNKPIVCKKSFWIYAHTGGILTVFPELTDRVKKGTVLAQLTNLYGETIDEVTAPTDAIVVAKSTNPVCEVGSRVIHLGVEWDDFKDNYAV